MLEELPGTALEYKEYEPLFTCAAECAEKQKKKGFYVTCADYVTMGDGTGIVHIAPAFGEDDAQVGRRYDLPFVPRRCGSLRLRLRGKGQITLRSLVRTIAPAKGKLWEEDTSWQA